MAVAPELVLEKSVNDYNVSISPEQSDTEIPRPSDLVADISRLTVNSGTL